MLHISFILIRIGVLSLMNKIKPSKFFLVVLVIFILTVIIVEYLGNK